MRRGRSMDAILAVQTNQTLWKTIHTLIKTALFVVSRDNSERRLCARRYLQLAKLSVRHRRCGPSMSIQTSSIRGAWRLRPSGIIGSVTTALGRFGRLQPGRYRELARVTIPAKEQHQTGIPTGIVFNSTAFFKVTKNGNSQPSLFHFRSTKMERISGWNPTLDSTHAICGREGERRKCLQGCHVGRGQWS